MNHVESSIKIYFTSEYGLFNMLHGNRELNSAKIKRIKSDILSGLDVLRFCPILVIHNKQTDRLDIIDGQHRFWVAKEMKSKVWYVLVENFSMIDIAKINSNTEKWTSKDYINLYIHQDNENYIKLRNFTEETGFPFSVSQRLLTNGKIGADSGVDKNHADKFKRGKFEVRFEKEAMDFYQKAKIFSDFPYWNSRHFLLALETIINAGKCDIIELAEKIKERPAELTKKESIKEYLANLEVIYNYRMRERRVIF